MSISSPIYPSPHFKRTAKKRFEDATHWAELRIRKDTNGEEYADVLIGWKGDKKWHAHWGINGDQTIKFERYRGMVSEIGKTVVSAKRGILQDVQLQIDPTIQPTRPFVLELEVNTNTREITVKRLVFV